jgi:hypothetical protein
MATPGMSCLKGKFFNFKEAKIVIRNGRKEYNRLRPHCSPDYRPPATEAIERRDKPINAASIKDRIKKGLNRRSSAGRRRSLERPDSLQLDSKRWLQQIIRCQYYNIEWQPPIFSHFNDYRLLACYSLSPFLFLMLNKLQKKQSQY